MIDSLNLDDELRPESDNEEQFTITSAELIKRMEKIWLNEKLCADILPYEDAIMDAVSEQTRSMELAIEQRVAAVFRHGKTALSDNPASLHTCEIARIRFMTTDYLRSRAKKIENFPHYAILEDARRLAKNVDPLLSEAERKFANDLKNASEGYYRTTFISNLPETLRNIDCDAIAPKPKQDSYILFRVVKTISAPDFANACTEAGADVLDLGQGLTAGDQHIMPYRWVAPLLSQGRISLIA